MPTKIKLLTIQEAAGQLGIPDTKLLGYVIDNPREITSKVYDKKRVVVLEFPGKEMVVIGSNIGDDYNDKFYFLGKEDVRKFIACRSTILEVDESKEALYSEWYKRSKGYMPSPANNSNKKHFVDIEGLCISVSDFEYLKKELERNGILPQKQPTGQGTFTNTSKVSFNDTDMIVTINDKEYLFEETTKKQRKTKLHEAYKLFKLLYKNQRRRIKKSEIGKALKFGDSEQRVFNAVSKARKVIESSPYSISTEKEYGDNRGGYQLDVKQIDLESS